MGKSRTIFARLLRYPVTMRAARNRYWMGTALAVVGLVVGYFGTWFWQNSPKEGSLSSVTTVSLVPGTVPLVAPVEKTTSETADEPVSTLPDDTEEALGEIAPERVLEPEEIVEEYVLPKIEDGTPNPIRIQIPSIGVDAAVEHVALTQSGGMDVPKDPGNAGWYVLGPRPGEIGSAAIAGHVAWYGGAAAVFKDLHKVSTGDTIFVHNDDGSDTAFIVREIRTYAADANATDVFVSSDGKAHLNLITCVGEWDQSAQQYAERLVVFADQQI